MSKHFVNKIEKDRRGRCLHRPETDRWDDFKEISVRNYGNFRGDVGIAPYEYSRNVHSCNRPGFFCLSP